MDDGTQMKYSLQVSLAMYFRNMDNFEDKYFLTKSKIIKWTQYISYSLLCPSTLSVSENWQIMCLLNFQV